MKRRPLASADVANLCEAHSWDDDINDGARHALEQAHRHIRRLMVRASRCAMLAERMEADNHRMANYLQSLLKQKGGAA